MRSVQKWLSCSPAVWRQEIRELTVLPILANNNNATRLLNITLSTDDDRVKTQSTKISTIFAQELETGNQGHRNRGQGKAE